MGSSLGVTGSEVMACVGDVRQRVDAPAPAVTNPGRRDNEGAALRGKTPLARIVATVIIY